MAVIIDGKVYRNLQEQVLANTRNIESLIGNEHDHAAKAIYVHKISWKYMSNTANVYLSYLSTKSTPYSSMADIFSHKNDTDLSTSEIVEYGDNMTIVKFSSTGAVKSAVVISVSDVDSHVGITSMSPYGFEFDKDEVISDWSLCL